jgi:AraC-like DNA-binding protein
MPVLTMAPSASSHASFCFSTQHVPAAQRVGIWREEFGRRVVHLDLTPLCEGPFHSDVTVRELPGLAVVTDASSAMRRERTRGLLADGNDDVFLLTPLSGTVVASQLARETVLGAGDAVLLSNSDIGSVTLPARARITSIRMQRKVLALRVAGLEDIFIRPVPKEADALRVLMAYLDVLQNNAAQATPELRDAVVAHIYDLVALALAAAQGRGEGAKAPLAALHSVLFVRACRMVDLRFGDPELGPDRIARQLGISTRLLQRIFAERGKTVMRHVFEERVNRAAKLLAAPEAEHRSITDIAFACGFSDSAHFSRAFAARMDATPSQWRRKAQCGGLR